MMVFNEKDTAVNDSISSPDKPTVEINAPDTEEIKDQEKEQLKGIIQDHQSSKIQEFENSIPTLDSVAKLKDKHTPGMALVGMVDHLDALEKQMKDADDNKVKEIMGTYKSCVLNKKNYLPARALCLERYRFHAKEHRIRMSANEFPREVVRLLNMPEKLGQ